MRLSLDLPRRRACGLTGGSGPPRHRGFPNRLGPGATGAPSDRTVPNHRFAVPSEHERPKSSDHRPIRPCTVSDSRSRGEGDRFHDALRGPLEGPGARPMAS